MEREDSPNWPALAIMRFVLAGLVVTSHVGIIVAESPLTQLRMFGPLAAVMGFFAISGFSIAHSITARPDGYARRRFWRIYPTFVVALALSTLPFLLEGRVFDVPAMHISAPTNLDIALNWVPIQSALVNPLMTNGPLWSLGIEVCFYILAPALLLIKPRLLWCAAIGSAVLYALGPKLNFISYEDSASLFNLAALLWAWLLGWLFYKQPHDQLVATAGVLIPCVCMSINNRYGGSLAPLTVGAVAMVLLNQDRIPKFAPRLARVGNWLGDVSYPLYVCHFPVLILSFLLFGITNWALLLVICLAVSAVVLHVVDRPLRRGVRALVARWRRPALETEPSSAS